MRSFGRLTWGCVLFGIVAAAACSADDPPPLDPIVDSDVKPASASMRRLLARQYTQSVGLMFGQTAASVAAPPADSALHGYQAIAASQQALTDSLVADYERSARAIAASVVSDPSLVASLADCQPEADGATERTCIEAFVTRVGRLAFRRPLETEEQAEYVDVATTVMSSAGELGTYLSGIEYAIVALLQSPSFLFQVEHGVALPGSSDVRKLNGFEVATRMSFFLVDHGPDETLLDAAAAGELDAEEGVREHAKRLVRTFNAREASAAFFAEYFVLTDLETLPKNPILFPDFSRAMALSMERETHALIKDVVWTRNAPVTELFTADYSFVDEQLALIYDVDAPKEPWSRVTLPSEQSRSGLLSQPAFLARQAHADGTSVTFRGMFILERLLCTSMPPPPDDVVTELPPSSAAPTMRERVAVHLKEKRCKGCHELVDGMGLALENFDAIGRHRTTENGAPIDASGESGFLGSFVGVKELSQQIANSEQATTCMVHNLFRHATGHIETAEELKAIEGLHGAFAAGGYHWRDLLVELAASPLMRAVGPLVVEENATEEDGP